MGLHESLQERTKAAISRAMAPCWWDSLSDSELRSRLLQRNHDPEEVQLAVSARDRDPRIRLWLIQILGED